jgi:hypothetical protein
MAPRTSQKPAFQIPADVESRLRETPWARHRRRRRAANFDGDARLALPASLKKFCLSVIPNVLVRISLPAGSRVEVRLNSRKAI